MKYIMQWITFLFSIIVAFAVVVIEKHVDMTIMNTPFALASGVFFIIISMIYFCLYVSLIIKEKKNKRLCFTIAQFCCIYSVVVNSGHAFMEFYWFFIVSQTGCFSPMLNLFYKILDIATAGAWLATAHLIAVSYLGFSIVPMWQPIVKKPIGEYLVEMGVDQEIIKEARKRQQNDEIR